MHQTFSGGVFSETIDGGRTGADIELTQSAVCALSPDGDAFVISYRECQIEVGGFSNRMLFCRNADRSVTIFCEDRQFPRALSVAAAGVLDEQLGASLKKRRRESRRGWLIGATVLVATVLLLVVGYVGIRIGARATVKALPVSIDRQLGSTTFKSMDLGGPEINDAVIVGAMQNIVDRLAPEAAIDGLQFEVHVVDSPAVNAYALPGGIMVVYTGLIQQAQNAEQVAGVLGHEMAHATLRHGLQRISQSMGIWSAVALLFGDAEGLIAAGAELFHFATINSYSREQENAADEEGVRMLHAAGIDPTQLASFFQLLEQEHGDLPGIVTWISTHPDHASRIASVDALVATLPKREFNDLEIDWPAIQDRVSNNNRKESGEE